MPTLTPRHSKLQVFQQTRGAQNFSKPLKKHHIYYWVFRLIFHSLFIWCPLDISRAFERTTHMTISSTLKFTNTFPYAWKYHRIDSTDLAPGNPTLWRGVPVASIQKSFGSSGRDWKPWKKLPIPCKFCTYRFIRYSSSCYGKVRINPIMANIRNPDFFASPVANAAWFVVVRPCYLNRDLLSGPKGN